MNQEFESFTRWREAERHAAEAQLVLCRGLMDQGIDPSREAAEKLFRLRAEAHQQFSHMMSDMRRRSASYHFKR